MSILGTILPNNIVVSAPVKNYRMALCNACPYVQNGFCGTPIIGTFIMHNNQKVHLCGCKMTEKTELKSAQCPIKKWI
jgi:hypothetical protein